MRDRIVQAEKANRPHRHGDGKARNNALEKKENQIKHTGVVGPLFCQIVQQCEAQRPNVEDQARIFAHDFGRVHEGPLGDFVGAVGYQVFHGVAGGLQMKLQAHHVVAMHKGLMGTPLAAGRVHRSGWYGKGVVVPVKGREVARKARKQGMFGPLAGQFHIQKASLFMRGSGYLCTQYVGNELRPKADAQHALVRVYGRADGAFFCGQPRVVGLVINIHGAAQHHQQVVAVGRWGRVTIVQVHGVVGVAVFVGPADDVGPVFEGYVLEKAKLHGRGFLVEARHVMNRSAGEYTRMGAVRKMGTQPKAGKDTPQMRKVHYSVVMPVLHEADVTTAVDSVRAALPGCEVVVVDGDPAGSSVQNVPAAQNVTTATSAPGRARQMNHGAGLATGDVLVFLHADTVLRGDVGMGLESALGRSPLAAFDLRIDGEGFGYRLIEWMVSRRSRVAGLPYGDQCLCIRRALFDAVGGYPDIPLMEDVALVRACARLGHRPAMVAGAHARTSARRWQRRGVVRGTLRNWALLVAYGAGVSPNRLARWYA